MPKPMSEQQLRGMEKNAKARYAKRELKLIAEVRRLRAQPRCDFPGACPMKEAPDA